MFIPIQAVKVSTKEEDVSPVHFSICRGKQKLN